MATVAGARPLWSERERAMRPDFVLIGTLVALAALSVLMVFSASAARLEAQGLPSTFDMRRQAIFAAVGALAFVGASLIQERALRLLVPGIYIGAVLVLLAVFPFGDAAQGAQRWIAIGSYQLQPSEFAKPAIVLTLAALLAPVEEGYMRWSRVFRAVGLVAVPSLLIFMQPDLGTMIVFGFVGLAMLFVAGTTMRQLVTLVVAAFIGLGVVLSLGVLETYQLQRLTAFLDQSADKETANYNQNQSEITIGSGQIFGKGLFDGDQTNLSFVPAQSTDFIFTAIAEQLGFVGAATVLFLYAVVVWRLLMISGAANSRFGQLLAAGVASLVGLHVFINVGMTMGLMPVTGLPLPFMSSGGSSFVAMAIGVGLAHSLWLQRSPVPGERAILRG